MSIFVGAGLVNAGAAATLSARREPCVGRQVDVVLSRLEHGEATYDGE